MICISSANARLLFKTRRIQDEYSELYEKNNELFKIVEKVNFITEALMGKSIVITEVYRTQEEQDRYYKGKNKFISPHQRWLAVDIRSRNFTEKEVLAIVHAINKNVNSKNTYIPTAFYHDIGLGKHIHMQFKKRK